MKKLLLLIAAAILILGGAGQALAATTADVIFVVDESGSMSGEHAWLGSMITSLDNNLIANGVTGNQYGLVGFGGSSYGGHYDPHSHTVGSGDWGSAAEFATATGGLVITGGTEDGWSAINYALDNYTFRANSAINIVLVTDEDRDNTNSAVTYNSLKTKLNSYGAILNSVVNVNFWEDGNAALGVSGWPADAAYVADGSGGYTKEGGAITMAAGDYYAAGSIAQYVNLALETSGAAWDLNQLRAGGNTAASFTDAFVDIKTEEIIIAPEPSFALLLGPALLGLVAIRRKIRK